MIGISNTLNKFLQVTRLLKLYWQFGTLKVRETTYRRICFLHCCWITFIPACMIVSWHYEETMLLKSSCHLSIYPFTLLTSSCLDFSFVLVAHFYRSKPQKMTHCCSPVHLLIHQLTYWMSVCSNSSAPVCCTYKSMNMNIWLGQCWDVPCCSGWVWEGHQYC